MRTFKLIKNYPGFTMPLECHNPNCETVYYTNKGHTLVNPTEYPEFWEEIKKKEYEILSFYTSGGIGTLRKDKTFSWAKDINFYGEFKESWFLNRPMLYKIHSIKRLSDGEIFTVNENLNYQHKDQVYSFTLNAIEFEIAPADKGKGILSFPHTNKRLGKWLDIDKLVKARTPLFTTEDAVDIFEGDSPYHILFDNSFPGSFIIGQFKDISNFCTKDFYRYFSTKEAAEKYIQLNKPSYSVNEIINFFNIDEESSIKQELIDYLSNLKK